MGARLMASDPSIMDPDDTLQSELEHLKTALAQALMSPAGAGQIAPIEDRIRRVWARIDQTGAPPPSVASDA